MGYLWYFCYFELLMKKVSDAILKLKKPQNLECFCGRCWSHIEICASAYVSDVHISMWYLKKLCLLLLEFGDNSLGTGWCHSCLTFATPWPVACEAPLHGIPQAGILEWAAILFSRASSQPRDQTRLSNIDSGFFTVWATREVLVGSIHSEKHKHVYNDMHP